MTRQIREGTVLNVSDDPDDWRVSHECPQCGDVFSHQGTCSEECPYCIPCADGE